MPIRRAYRRSYGTAKRGVARKRLSVGVPTQRRSKARLPYHITGSTLMSRVGGLFPTRIPLKGMKYAADFILTAGSGGVGGTARVFQLNCLAAPESTGGHQPYQFDQVSAVYAEYIVTGVRITLKFFHASSQTVQPIWIIRRSNETFSTAGLFGDNVTERERGYRGIMSLTGPNFTIWSQYFTMSGIDGVPARLSDQGAYSGYSLGANPVNIPTLIISAADQNQNAGTTCVCAAVFEYDGYFFARNNSTQS